MTRRLPVAMTKPTTRPTGLHDWPPTCTQCGWQGEPNEKQSPHIACHGDPGRHIRPPIGRT